MRPDMGELAFEIVDCVLLNEFADQDMIDDEEIFA